MCGSETLQPRVVFRVEEFTSRLPCMEDETTPVIASLLFSVSCQLVLPPGAKKMNCPHIKKNIEANKIFILWLKIPKITLPDSISETLNRTILKLNNFSDFELCIYK